MRKCNFPMFLAQHIVKALGVPSPENIGNRRTQKFSQKQTTSVVFYKNKNIIASLCTNEMIQKLTSF